jgi:photosystem II stability/assembly factor-like uncharacterized protein
MANATNAFVGGGASGAGPEVLFTQDGGDSFTDEKPAPDSLLVLDCAAWSDFDAICSGIDSIQHTTDGHTWEKSIDIGGGQSAERIIGSGKGFAVVSEQAVHASKSGSELFESHKFTGIDTANYPGRYGAYPSAQVWYISAGKFPTAPPPAPNADYEEVHRISERHSVRKDKKTGKLSHHFHHFASSTEKTTFDFSLDNGNATAGLSDGYTGAIYKTTDGGTTWKMLFEDQDHFYFNGIHCISETHCVAVGEGHASENSGSYIYTSTDGATFKQTHFESEGGAMGVRMVSETEVWVAATSPGKAAKSNFYRSTDGGASWASAQEVLDSSPIGLDCADSQHCIAPAVNPLTQTCTLITFKPQA